MPINLLHKKTMFAMLFIWRQFCISVLLHSATAVILAMEQKNRDPLIRHIYCWSLNYLCAPSLPLCWLWKWKRKKLPIRPSFTIISKGEWCIASMVWIVLGYVGACCLLLGFIFFRWFAKYWKYRIKIFIICSDSIDHIRKTYANFGVWIVPFLRNMNLSIKTWLQLQNEIESIA